MVVMKEERAHVSERNFWSGKTDHDTRNSIYSVKHYTLESSTFAAQTVVTDRVGAFLGAKDVKNASEPRQGSTMAVERSC